MEPEIKVIVVDRHTLVREGLRQILAAETDIQVAGMASDGTEAVELAARLQPDVAILDANLPGVEAVVRHLAMEHPGTGVLILAGNQDVQQVLNLLWAGARGYLDKSVDSRDLITAVRQVSRGEMVLGPGVAKGVVDRLAYRDLQAASPGHEPYEALTEREMEVLRLLCQGYSDKEIAQRLYISVRTVGVHLYHIYEKLGVHSRTEAALYAVRKGWVSLEQPAL